MKDHRSEIIDTGAGNAEKQLRLEMWVGLDLWWTAKEQRSDVIVNHLYCKLFKIMKTHMH